MDNLLTQQSMLQTENVSPDSWAMSRAGGVSRHYNDDVDDESDDASTYAGDITACIGMNTGDEDKVGVGGEVTAAGRLGLRGDGESLSTSLPQRLVSLQSRSETLTETISFAIPLTENTLTTNTNTQGVISHPSSSNHTLNSEQILRLVDSLDGATDRLLRCLQEAKGLKTALKSLNEEEKVRTCVDYCNSVCLLLVSISVNTSVLMPGYVIARSCLLINICS